MSGWVAIVGAGPGDPGLLTLRGYELLRAADVILCDRLVSAGVRARMPAHARVIDVGKGRGSAVSQHEVSRILVEEVRAGHRVVRLKGGDAFVFGRGAEEVLALAAAGFDVEVVAGVTSAIAGPASAGIPVTHRGVASSVCILTAEETGGARTDWRSAAHADTVVLLMGVAGLAHAADSLIHAGKQPTTPAAIIQDATRPTQRVFHGSLKAIARIAEASRIESPAIVVIGRSVPLAKKLGTQLARTALPKGALAGMRVLVTRPAHQARALADALRARDAEPVIAPAIRIEPAPKRAIETTLRRIVREGPAWIVFTSANGVAATFDALDRLKLDARAFAHAKLAAIGSATAEALRARGLTADLVATDSTTLGLAREIPAGSGRALLLRADRADPALTRALASKGYDVLEVTAYRIVPETRWPRPVLLAIRSGDVRLVTFASAETAQAAARILRHARIEPSQLDAVCIGPVCAKGARAAGFRVAATATEPTVDALADAAARARGRVSRSKARR